MPVITIILVAVMLAVAGQILVKAGLNRLGIIDFSAGVIKTYLKIFLTPMVLLGTISYTFSGFFWIYALTKADLSYAFPFLILSYVLIILSSWLILGESIPLMRWIGIFIICLGMLLVYRT